MKKLFITSFFVVATTSFAALTVTNDAKSTDKLTSGGWNVSGTGTAAELVELIDTDTLPFMYLTGTLNFDDATDINLNTIVRIGSANYTFSSGKFVESSTSGVANLVFSGSGKLITPKTEGTSDGGLTSQLGTLNITVNEGAGGIVACKICALNTVNLNLHQKNAIVSQSGGAFITTAVATFTINTTAEQHISFDIRNGCFINLKPTESAKIFVDSVSQILYSGGSNTGGMRTNGLEDGYILFADNTILSGYDASLGTIILQMGSLKQTINVLGASGSETLKDLNWYSTDIDGNKYWVLTAISVPEPAEWAAVFGALAIALAIYRRKK